MGAANILMNKSFYPEIGATVNAAPVPYSTTDLATVAQKFTVAPKVAPHVRKNNAFIRAYMHRVSDSAWKVFEAIVMFHGGGDHAFPSIADLMEVTGKSDTTVGRNLKELAKLGLIEYRPSFCPETGRQRANDYFLLVHPAKFYPGPLSKNNPLPPSKIAPPTNRNKKHLKTETTNSAGAELFVEVDKSNFVENDVEPIAHTAELPAIETQKEAIEPLLAELERLNASNATTRRALEADPANAATQLQNLAAAKNVGSAGALFMSLMQRRAPLSASKAHSAPDSDDCANSDARREWKRDDAPQSAVKPDSTPAEAVARMKALVGATLAMLTPQNREVCEKCIADLELRAQCEYLDRTTVEFQAARKSLARAQ